MIYIASPYSHPDSHIRYQRFLAVRDYTIKLIKQEHAAFSPIAYCYQFERMFELPGDAQFWLAFNAAFLTISDEMRVLMLEGWDKSEGVELEIDLAAKHNIPVKYIPVLK